MTTAKPKAEVKPGWKSTEFWVSVGTAVLGILAASGQLTPEQSSALSKALVQISGLVATVGATFGYNLSRGKAKSKGG